ncbi:ABC transporter substrate-binding protein [Jiangella muralis]|uniref:ABC transporter substrate-binding protein n=1 Tax=Jiangella muralis TaxID=702383 RepID=UPI00069E82D0|nr:ABC transporter substrate-binding protein [Jiangella muralis]
MIDNGMVSRRSLLKLGGIAVTLPLLGTVACSRTPAPSGEPSAGGDGAQLTIAVSALMASLDREYEIGAASMEAMNNLFEPLVEFSRRPFGDSGSPRQHFDSSTWELRLLAEEPAVSDDGLTWTLVFRDDVSSHSGNPLTAEDFAYAIERHQQVWVLGSFYNFVAGLLPRERISWNVVDAQTLEVTTEQPSPLFKILLQNNFAFGLFDAVASRAAGTDADPWATEWMKANGSEAGHGPYTISSHQPGQQTVFTAFDGYHGGAPAVQTVVHRQVDSSSTRVALLKSGEVDIVRDLLPTELKSLEGADGVVVDNFDQSLFLLLFMMMNNSVAPFDDPLVRQAVAYATPYQQIVDDVYQGYASPWKGVISRDYPYFDPDAWIYGDGANPDKARELLAQAGYADGFSCELLCNSSEPVSEQVAILVQSSLSEIGIDFRLNKLSAAAFTERLTGKQYEGAAIWQDLALTPDIGYNCFLYYRSTAFANVAGYASDSTDQLIDVLLTTMDGPEREAVAKEFQRQIVADSPAVFLAQPHYVVARRDHVKGVTAYPSRTIRFDEIELAR